MSQTETIQVIHQPTVPTDQIDHPNQQNAHNATAINPPNTPNPAESPHPLSLTNIQILTIMTSLCACIFIAALDVTIVTTALPTITAHFKSNSAYTWIGTAFVLAHTASTPSWGKISDIWGRKPVMLVANAIFFAGSLVCALVDELDVFIAGRAIQGLGAGGMQTMVNICISDLFSQRDRGVYYGLTSVVWAVASGVGPVIGGAFTAKLSWRWCFWINLPIIGAVFVLLLVSLKLPTPNTSIRAGLKAIDWSGSFLIAGGTLMLLLGLYLGGIHDPWNSPTVVSLIVFGIVSAGLFILNEWKMASYPVIPIHLFRSVSSAAAYALCFFHGFVFLGTAYYLPLYFQAVLLASPLVSGVYLLPFILSSCIVAALTGLYIQKTGKYMPAMYIGLVIMTLGIGLLIDVGVDKNWGKMIGFQVIAGAGVGMNWEGPLLAVQAVLPSRDVAAATTTMGFMRTISTAISVVIGGVVFQNQMNTKQGYLKEKLGEELAAAFDGANATFNVELVKTLPEEQQFVVRTAFYESMRTMWIVYVGLSAVALIIGFLVRGHHLSKEHQITEPGLREDGSGSSEPAQTTGRVASEAHEMQLTSRRA